MLRITTDAKAGAMTLKLEGSLTGPWVSEFRKSWDSIANSHSSEKFAVDLRGVTQMNAEARQILAEIHKKTGADFLADTPLTKYFAERALQLAHEIDPLEEV